MRYKLQQKESNLEYNLHNILLKNITSNFYCQIAFKFQPVKDFHILNDSLEKDLSWELPTRAEAIKEFLGVK